MTDIYDKEKRSWVMSRISGKNTQPEIIVRKLAYSMGYRYRINYPKLPGKPDIVFTKLKKVIFIHGCFWHGHECCKKSKKPSTNQEFWDKKINDTISRDYKKIEELQTLGWSVLVIWQCELNDLAYLKQKIEKFLMR